MWTDFRSGDVNSMRFAATHLNDFRLIRDTARFTPEISIAHHREFTDALEDWFVQQISGPRVVIAHHVPVENPKSQHLESPLQPAFISSDIKSIIEMHAPVMALRPQP